MKPGIAISVLLVAFSATTLAEATTYYAATNGGQNAAGTLAAPFSVNKAASTAKAGDTVYFRGGTYSGSLIPASSGTASAWITFAAYTGELPIFDGKNTGGTGVGSSTAQYIKYVGLVSRNYTSSGFSNGWTDENCAKMSNGNVQYINCVADGNGINGMAFYCASGLLIQQSIVAHNGNVNPSWSSGVNVFHAFGDYTTNVVRQTVSFENVDISTHHSDGSGFILDQNSTGALFENNIGFRNGGSCIRLTNSAGAHMVNNSCYHDGLDASDALGLPPKPGEIFFSDSTSKNGATFFNNLAAASGYNNDQTAFAGLLPSGQTNFSVDANGVTPFFTDPAGTNPDLHLTASALTGIVDKGTSANAPTTDIGFDPKCIKKASTASAPAFWQYQVDYTYITSIGGVAACFKPSARSGAPDIGAYEYSGAAPACSSDAQCNDSDICTTDSCAAGVCNHAAVSGCCKAATDCDDTNPCTADSCNATSHACSHAAVTGCCQQDSACNDGNACTADSCNLSTHQCATNPISNCCNGNADCSGSSACVAVSCNLSTHACASSTVPNCCSSNASCDDQNPCTTDSCNLSSGACSSTTVAACCQLDGDCNDQNPCTADKCNLTSHTCTHGVVTGCCTADSPCDDGKSCTLDTCNLALNQCAHAADPACNAAGGTAGTGGAAGASAGTSGMNGGGMNGGGMNGGGASGGGASFAGSSGNGGSAGLGSGGSGSSGSSGLNAGGMSLGGADAAGTIAGGLSLNGGGTPAAGAASAAATPDDHSGCACSVPRPESSTLPKLSALLALAGLGLLRARRKNRTSSFQYKPK